jgi:hypothetical protein
MMNSCCQDFADHAKNLDKSGFGIYSAPGGIAAGKQTTKELQPPESEPHRFS